MRFPRTNRPFLAALAGLLVLGQALCGCLSVMGEPVSLRSQAATEKLVHLSNGHGHETAETHSHGGTGSGNECPPEDCEHCTIANSLVAANPPSVGDDGPADGVAILASSAGHLAPPGYWPLPAPRGPPALRLTPVTRFDVLIA